MMARTPDRRDPLAAVLLFLTASLLHPSMARAAHPLITEDAYTLGEGVAQVEIGFEHAHFDQPNVEGSVNEVRGFLSYGLSENIDALATNCCKPFLPNTKTAC